MDNTNSARRANRHRAHTDCANCGRTVAVRQFAALDPSVWCWTCLGFDGFTARGEAIRFARDLAVLA